MPCVIVKIEKLKVKDKIKLIKKYNVKNLKKIFKFSKFDNCS